MKPVLTFVFLLLALAVVGGCNRVDSTNGLKKDQPVVQDLKIESPDNDVTGEEATDQESANE